MSSILKMGVYDPDSHKFSKRYKNTYKAFPDLNSEALGLTLTALAQGEAGDFSNTYGRALHDVLKRGEVLTEQREAITGKWRPYQQCRDWRPLMRDTANQATGWCFASNALDAKEYTEKGDQWIYFTPGTDGTFTVPRIGIAIRDGEIFEVHGVAKGQAMEGSMADIAQQKLAEFPRHEQFQRRIGDSKQLAVIEGKTKPPTPQPLNKTDLMFLYEVDTPISTFAQGKDDRITELLVGRDVNADMLIIFECTSDLD